MEEKLKIDRIDKHDKTKITEWVNGEKNRILIGQRL